MIKDHVKRTHPMARIPIDVLNVILKHVDQCVGITDDRFTVDLCRLDCQVLTTPWKVVFESFGWKMNDFVLRLVITKQVGCVMDHIAAPPWAIYEMEHLGGCKAVEHEYCDEWRPWLPEHREFGWYGQQVVDEWRHWIIEQDYDFWFSTILHWFDM